MPEGSGPQDSNQPAHHALEVREEVDSPKRLCEDDLREDDLPPLPALPSQDIPSQSRQPSPLEWPRLWLRHMPGEANVEEAHTRRWHPVAALLVLAAIAGAAFVGRQITFSALPEKPVQVFYAPVARPDGSGLVYIRRSVLFLDLPGGFGLGGDLFVRGDTLALCTRPLPAPLGSARQLSRPRTLPAGSPTERCLLRWRLPPGRHAPTTVRPRIRLAGDTLYYRIALIGLEPDSLEGGSLVELVGGRAAPGRAESRATGSRATRSRATGGRRPNRRLGPRGLLLAQPLRRQCFWRRGAGMTCVLTNRPEHGSHPRKVVPEASASEASGTFIAELSRAPGGAPHANRLVLRSAEHLRPAEARSYGELRSGSQAPGTPDSLSRHEARHLLVRLTEALEALTGTGSARPPARPPGKRAGPERPER